MANSGSGTPQLTLRAVILAVVLAMILSAANAYLGLFAGLTIATAIPAAVVSMGVLRLLGGGTILENNIVQTGASAGSSIAAGVIFTIPALIILGYWQDFKYSWVLAIAGLGGLLGVLFSVPLRRSMIVEEPLPFPEGKAAAEVLKAGENPGPGLKILGISASLGGTGQAGRGQRFPHDPGQRGRCRFLRQVPRVHGHQPVARAARRGLHRRPQHRHRGRAPAASSPGTSRSRSITRSC
jgi:OPT family oligopeptide transporter